MSKIIRIIHSISLINCRLRKILANIVHHPNRRNNQIIFD